VGDAKFSTFATVSHDLHHLRRSVLNPLFSKKRISESKSLIESKISILISEVEAALSRNTIIPLDLAMTTDIISEFCNGFSNNYLQQYDHRAFWKSALFDIVYVANIMRLLPWIYSTVQLIPTSVLRVLSQRFPLLRSFRHQVRERAKEVMKMKARKGSEILGQEMETSVLQGIFESGLPANESTLDRLLHEGFIFLLQALKPLPKFST
jgi:hypothetical protein